jgi:hypothetical protein
MMQLFQQSTKRHAVYAFAEQSLPPIDMHKELKRSGRATEIRDLFKSTETARRIVPSAFADTEPMRSKNAPSIQIAASTIDGESSGSVALDFGTWLPYSAPHYQISPNIEDHVITPVVVMPADIPNRNSVAFPLEELVKFHPTLGQQAFKTWRGKPTHHEHDNEDITKAYGVIPDAYLRKLTGFGQGAMWKVLLLLSFDRQKHPDVVRDILAGERNSYSMGAWVGSYRCSCCGAEVGECNHIRKEGHHHMYELNGQLVFKNCIDIEGFECSQVGTPAYISAISDVKHELRERPLP